jgi:hypothetical protein
VKLDAAIIFAPAGELIPIALSGLAKGGTIACGGIHMSSSRNGGGQPVFLKKNPE